MAQTSKLRIRTHKSPFTAEWTAQLGYEYPALRCLRHGKPSFRASYAVYADTRGKALRKLRKQLKEEAVIVNGGLKLLAKEHI